MKNKGTSLIAIAALLLASCGGGSTGSPAPQPQEPDPPVGSQPVFQTPAVVGLTVADIQQIIAQGVAEAQAQNQPSGFVVIDRVGNVLAVFVMNGTNLTLRTPAAPNGQSTDLQNLNLPAPAAVAGGISKALTSSYFSSVGAAFSSRTANDISGLDAVRRENRRHGWRAMSLRGQHPLSCCVCPLLHDFSHLLVSCPSRLDAFERYCLQLRIERIQQRKGRSARRLVLRRELRKLHQIEVATAILRAHRALHESI